MRANMITGKLEKGLCYIEKRIAITSFCVRSAINSVNMIKLFNYLLILNVFWSGFVLFASPFEFYVGYIFIMAFLTMYVFHYHNIGINSKFLITLIAITFFSLVNVYLENTTLVLMGKQALGILVTGVAYYLLIKINKYEIDKLFRIYLRIAFVVASIGIFQEFSFLVGFENGYDYSTIIPKWGFTATTMGALRVNSILPEPSHFAISMAPAFFVSLLSVLRNSSLYLSKKASLLVIISYVLTFSAVAYIAIIISFLLIYSNAKKIRHLLFAAIILFSSIFLSYRYIPEIRIRVDDTLGVATGSIDIATANMSTFTLVSNAFVAYDSFKNSPLFGRGLGSHPISYDKFASSGSSDVIFLEGALQLNKDDANSLFLRLTSETGLFGIIVALYFLFKFRLKNSDNENLQIISNAIFTIFTISLLRQGHYFYNGFFFFVWLYYFAYRIYNGPQYARRLNKLYLRDRRRTFTVRPKHCG